MIDASSLFRRPDCASHPAFADLLDRRRPAASSGRVDTYGVVLLSPADLLELMDSQAGGLVGQHMPSPHAQADAMLSTPAPSGLALVDGASRCVNTLTFQAALRPQAACLLRPPGCDARLTAAGVALRALRQSPEAHDCGSIHILLVALPRSSAGFPRVALSLASPKCFKMWQSGRAYRRLCVTAL